MFENGKLTGTITDNGEVIHLTFVKQVPDKCAFGCDADMTLIFYVESFKVRLPCFLFCKRNHH